jgi:hypothetical protein
MGSSHFQPHEYTETKRKAEARLASLIDPTPAGWAASKEESLSSISWELTVGGVTIAKLTRRERSEYLEVYVSEREAAARVEGILFAWKDFEFERTLAEKAIASAEEMLDRFEKAAAALASLGK